MLKNKFGKLKPRLKVCPFVGYLRETRGRLFYSYEENKVFVSKNATFLEENYMKEYNPQIKVVLEELLPSLTSTQSTTVVDTNIGPTMFGYQTISHQNDLPPRHSERVVRQSARYLDFRESQVAIFNGSVDDLLTYRNAMKDFDKKEWLKSMNLEMGSMYSNLVWELVDQPYGIKPIGCKWIYKRKR